MRLARIAIGMLAALWAMSPAVPSAPSGSGQLEPAASSGSISTAIIESEQAYQQPASVLNARELEQFAEGRKNFAQHWVVAPSILGLWGRGPTSNAEACTDCHEHGGRGQAPADVTQPMQSMLVRLSIPGAGPHGGPNPHRVYGDQLQNEGILGRVPPEGDPRLTWDARSVTMADGEIAQLRAPTLKFQALNFGPFGAEVMTSMRVAPSLIGVGLLDAVSEDTIRALEADQRRRGLRGHSNRVWDLINNREALGRFGHKANQPSVEQQIFLAYHADLGVTSRWFPEENCTEVQFECLAEPPGGHPELPTEFVDPVLFFARALAAPARRNIDDAQVRRGEALFHLAGCDGCHAPTLETGDYAALPVLSHRTIHPYTDLLLHDMGEGLADGRPDFRAGARDWRTTPLWGLGLSRGVNGNDSLLHDGRARNATEAILWHGGEAQSARDAFRGMPKADREALIAFLRSL